MYNHIEGRLLEKHPTHAVIDCNGVGYLIQISLSTYGKIGSTENCRLLVHLSVKEDSLSFYGFADEMERRIFRQLISVSGVGESTARMVLSSLHAQEVEQAIASGNAALLQSVKGIGAKTAQRVILDLQDKIRKTDTVLGVIPGSLVQDNKIREQALTALVTLGFNRNAAEKVVAQLLKSNASITVEELIRQSLNSL